MIAAIRSVLHLAWMGLTVWPYSFVILGLAAAGVRGERLYWWAVGWLRWAIVGARLIMGVRYRIQGQENLPTGVTSPAILLVKHQSTYETFLMPVIMPHPLAYVFKKELLRVPFFGWAMARLDMVHIDRSKRTEAWNRVAEQGRRLFAQGTWVIMFPEGTRIERGQVGTYKTGGTRRASETGAPVSPIAGTSAKPVT